MHMLRFPFAAPAGFLFAALFAGAAHAQTTPIQIVADLTDAPRKLYHAEVELPVSPGPLTLITPQWIPGNHRPTGPVSDITGVVFTSDGKPIEWRRDDVNMYEFHLTIPPGVTRLHAHLDCIVTVAGEPEAGGAGVGEAPALPGQHPGAGHSHSAVVEGAGGLGCGDGAPAGERRIVAGSRGGKHDPVRRSPTWSSLRTRPSSPGNIFHEFALAPEITPKHYLDVVSDEPEDSNLRPAFLAEVSNLVREASVEYASHHYHVYHFLLTLSDVAGGEGLEHGQSSDNGVGEKGFSDDAHQVAEADLLSHEFTHSWNGKYRRPVGLYQPDFATPQQGALLWVYEGMTQYLGNVLAARSGLKSQAQYRDLLAMSAASLDYKPGRDWRPTEDTAVAASVLRGGNPAWSNWRRGQDYYQEGELLWLDADTLIRKMTDNKKSLDDFEKIFLAKGGNTGPMIVTYNFDELVEDLNEVAPYDWAAFLHDRVDKIHPHADLDGIEQGGYKLVYKDKPNPSARMMAAAGGRRFGGIDCWYSIGLRLNGEGNISDVLWNGPADKAGLAPGEKIIAVNGQIYSPDRLREAIRDAKGNTEPIKLIVQADTYVHDAEIDYHGGERYPALERVEGTPDYLDDITAPRTTPEKAPEPGK